MLIKWPHISKQVLEFAGTVKKVEPCPGRSRANMGWSCFGQLGLVPDTQVEWVNHFQRLFAPALKWAVEENQCAKNVAAARSREQFPEKELDKTLACTQLQWMGMIT